MSALSYLLVAGVAVAASGHGGAVFSPMWFAAVASVSVVAFIAQLMAATVAGICLDVGTSLRGGVAGMVEGERIRCAGMARSR